jgi:hypothetical protein
MVAHTTGEMHITDVLIIVFVVTYVSITAFAIMRNSHESFRTAIKEMAGYINADEASFGNFLVEWSGFKRVCEVHKAMEDLDLFPLLTAANGGQDINLEHLHIADQVNSQGVDDAIVAMEREAVPAKKSALWLALGDVFCTWRDVHLAHLEMEEKILYVLRRSPPLISIVGVQSTCTAC